MHLRHKGDGTDDGATWPAKPSKVIRRAATTCLGLLVFYFVVPVGVIETPLTFLLQIILSVAVFVGIVLAINLQLLRQIDQPDAPLGGLLAGVVGGLLFFALFDYVVAIHASGQFVGLHTRVDSLYFALATFATIGYGDVHAQGQLARGILCVQMVFDVAVLATGGSMLARQIGARVRGNRPHR
jgi:voltage-gated potassium channel